MKTPAKDAQGAPGGRGAPLRLHLRVLGEPLQFEGVVPEGDLRLDQALPLLRELDDAVIARAERRSEREGRRTSCQKGCSRCCRAQPVPVAPAEAYALLLLVEGMPAPRRAALQARFADRVQRLRAAGLFDVLLAPPEDLREEEARAIVERYFRLGLSCPFLDDDACSIHPQRPFVCRQYLVSSPRELCEDPFHNPVQVLPMPLAPATAILKTGEDLLGGGQAAIPLVLALEYAAAHRAELSRTFPGGDLLRRCITAIFQR